jgi:hypothetical protein
MLLTRTGVMGVISSRLSEKNGDQAVSFSLPTTKRRATKKRQASE